MGNRCPFLMDLNIVKLVITIPADRIQAVLKGLAGSGSRFEQQLYSVCCTNLSADCDQCTSSDNCPYQLLAGRKLSTDPDIVRQYQRPALPYIFSFLHDLNLNNRIALTLLGPAIHHIPCMISAVAQLADLDRLPQFHAVDSQGRSHEISEGMTDRLPVLSLADLLENHLFRYADCTKIRLDTITPMRLVHDGFELNRMEPGVLLCAMLRRVSSLVAYYGSGQSADYFRYLSGFADSLELLRFNLSQAVSYLPRMRGVHGSFLIKGDFSSIGPILELGSLLHIGKGGAYGQGDFRIEPK